ncbi:hypothetical protein KAR91_88430 [Candidatus Pacearchaeota archaeon]|nr:hypothetical protein [Candidatus Pacearchaeota archaeon]
MDTIRYFVSFCKDLGIEFNIPVVLVIFVCTTLIFKSLDGTKSKAEKYRVFIPFILGVMVQSLYDASFKTVEVLSVWNGVMATVVAVLVHAPLEAGFKKIGIKF